jgi:hypothetical protein
MKNRIFHKTVFAINLSGKNHTSTRYIRQVLNGVKLLHIHTVPSQILESVIFHTDKPIKNLNSRKNPLFMQAHK